MKFFDRMQNLKDRVGSRPILNVKGTTQKHCKEDFFLETKKEWPKRPLPLLQREGSQEG